jgi:hypothetical protein
MANTYDVEAMINQTLNVATRALEAETETDYQQLQSSIHQLEALAREASQVKLSDLSQPILNKLENDEVLSEADQDVLKFLLVGAADYYLQHEDDVDIWRDEVKRLLEEIGKLQRSGLDEIDNLTHLQALCREAMRVVPDLTYYFREQERVRKFEAASREPLDSNARHILADLIRAMMASDKM